MVDIWNLHSIHFIKEWAQKKMGLKKSASLVCFALLFNLMKHFLRNLYPLSSKERRNASRSKGHNFNWKLIYSSFCHIMQYNIILLTIYKTWALVLWTLGAFDKGDTNAASLHTYFNHINSDCSRHINYMKVLKPAHR